MTRSGRANRDECCPVGIRWIDAEVRDLCGWRCFDNLGIVCFLRCDDCRWKVRFVGTSTFNRVQATPEIAR